MKILILGNMANAGYAVAKGLRKKNIDVDLAINKSQNVMALPKWEDANFDNSSDSSSQFKPDPKWKDPDWVKYFDFKNNQKISFIDKIAIRINLIRMVRNYDVIEAHVPYSIYTQFSGIPYVPYDAGWIRYFPFKNGLRDKLARRAYRKAKKIMMANPDTFEIFDKLSYLDKDKIHFVPFAIDPDKFKPSNEEQLRSEFARPTELLLFSPARQNWFYKGNNKMIRGFAKFAKQFPNSKLILVDWDSDIEKSKNLIEELRITNKVGWIKPLTKNKLIQFFNIADIVLDQFTLGSWGGITPEAMACGKPVLIYLKENHIIRAFGEMPPLLNSFTDEEIYSNLIKLANEDFRKEIGKKSREWVIKTHSTDIVSERHLDILKSVVE